MVTKTQRHEFYKKTFFLLKKLCVSWCLNAFVAKTFITLDSRIYTDMKLKIVLTFAVSTNPI